MAGAGGVTWHDVAPSSAIYPTVGLSREAALKRFHVKTAEGVLLSGAEALPIYGYAFQAGGYWARSQVIAWCFRLLRPLTAYFC